MGAVIDLFPKEIRTQPGDEPLARADAAEPPGDRGRWVAGLIFLIFWGMALIWLAVTTMVAVLQPV